MNQAFYTGITGLQTQQTGIDVTSNNLANIDTVGFRGDTVEFKSLFENALSTTSGSSSVNSSVGYGSGVQAIPTLMQTGSLMLTDSATDLAINGNGWFGVQGNGQTMYTRAGNFSFDASRDLVNGDGQYVLGTLTNNFDTNNILTSKETTAQLGDASAQTSIKLPETLTYPAEPTTLTSFKGNLGQDDVVRKMGATMVDSQGNRNVLNLTFTKTVPQPAIGSSWDVVATATSPVTLSGTSTLYDTQSGVLTFDDTGALAGSTLSSINNNGTTVSIDFGTGYDGIISNITPITASSQSNGLEAGELVGYDINQNADVIATFTNGRQAAMAKIGVFHFQNDQGLQRVDGSRFVETPNSGQPIFYQDANGNNILGAGVVNNKLESSNVRTDVGLTELIAYQRAYDASAKLITTGDQMIQKALQMHR
ncbi:flagellar hook-basal body complex protein [Sulfurimonas sp. HSL-1716]|uniref:flagellar hook protein FlgE n=1 Tax=Hydrocurvibacter sulfurireducens TaxID=3131937 RepID=UPI0031F79C8F